MNRWRGTLHSDGAWEAEGARVVCQMDEFSAHQRWFIMSLRCWMNAPDYTATIRNSFPGDPGAEKKMICARSCEAFLCNLAVSAQRPIARHAVDSSYVGQDEVSLLSVMHHAGIGDRYGARIHAARLVRSERLGPLIDAAEDLNLALSDNIFAANGFERPAVSASDRHLH